ASAVASSFSAAADTFPAGSALLEGLDPTPAKELAARFGLELRGIRALPEGKRHALDLPRVALYHTWVYTQDEGWARFTFEQAGVPYTSIHKDDLRGGGLRRRFDVVVVPSTGGASLESLIHEHDRRFGPMPFTKTAAYPSHGTPSSTPDMTGGPGFEGLAELQRFVEEGGVIVALEAATRLLAETGIARPLDPLTPRNLFHPGSVVRVKARRPDHPILFGYPEVTHVFRGAGPLYQVAKRHRDLIVLQYGTKKLRDEEEDTVRTAMLGIPEPPPVPAEATPAAAAPRDSAAADGRAGPGRDPSEYVLSGMVRGQDEILGQGAIFDVPVGRGRVLAFTFNPLHRFLNHHEFAMVWNALLFWNDLGEAPPE
ncbi:MAG: peptidase, partial [Gemmatimonadetes bacterium]|nr:peptidase [Gemmatimonadota bacterium]